MKDAGGGTGGQPDGDEAADADPGDGRDESLNERMDRNWNEILQELRVTQTGTQVLTGFLLTVAFQPRFASLTSFQRDVYLVLVVAAVLTTLLALAPVNLHRMLFRHHLKQAIVQTGHVILQITLAGVAVVLTGTVVLIFDVTVGTTAAVVAGAVAVLLVVAVALLPAVLRRAARSPGRTEASEPVPVETRTLSEVRDGGEEEGRQGRPGSEREGR